MSETKRLKCTHCDFVGDVPDDGYIYNWRHWLLRGEAQHDLWRGPLATKSVLDADTDGQVQQ